MPIARSFYFIRHGQTDWNKEGLVQGQSDIPLNEKGRAQAKQSAQAVAHLPIDMLLVSTLGRAQETAEIINQTLNKPLVSDGRLVARNYGNMEGKLKKDIPQWRELSATVFPEEIEINDSMVAFGGETIPDIQTRVATSINEHLENNPNKNILIISHGGIYTALYRLLSDKNTPSEELIPDNATPYLFEKTAKGWNIKKI